MDFRILQELKKPNVQLRSQNMNQKSWVEER